MMALPAPNLQRRVQPASQQTHTQAHRHKSQQNPRITNDRTQPTATSSARQPKAQRKQIERIVSKKRTPSRKKGKNKKKIKKIPRSSGFLVFSSFFFTAPIHSRRISVSRFKRTVGLAVFRSNQFQSLKWGDSDSRCPALRLLGVSALRFTLRRAAVDAAGHPGQSSTEDLSCDYKQRASLLPFRKVT